MVHAAVVACSGVELAPFPEAVVNPPVRFLATPTQVLEAWLDGDTRTRHGSALAFFSVQPLESRELLSPELVMCEAEKVDVCPTGRSLVVFLGSTRFAELTVPSHHHKVYPSPTSPHADFESGATFTWYWRSHRFIGWHNGEIDWPRFSEVNRPGFLRGRGVC